MPYVETDELVRWLLRDFMLGREGPSDHTQDFLFKQNDQALVLRKLYLTDLGDPPDLALRRIGPDGAAWDTPRSDYQPPTPGSNLGTLYWQGWDGEGFGDRSAQVYCRKEGDGSGGSLHLATTPEDGHEPVDRLTIGPDGMLDFGDTPIGTDDHGPFVLVRVHGVLAKWRLEIA